MDIDNERLLLEQTQDFTRDLNRVFFEIWGESPFENMRYSNDRQRVKSKRVLLTKGGHDTSLSGDFSYVLALDRENKYLSVQKSDFNFYLDSDLEPLFRYEFEKSYKNVPRAHLQLHLERDHPDQSRIAEIVSRRSPTLSSIHFPLGGSLLRPCLEDILLMCNYDLSIGLTDQDVDLLLEELRTYRRKQAKAIYREYLEVEFGPLKSRYKKESGQ